VKINTSAFIQRLILPTGEVLQQDKLELLGTLYAFLVQVLAENMYSSSLEKYLHGSDNLFPLNIYSRME
jgi:hypothetical protein